MDGPLRGRWPHNPNGEEGSKFKKTALWSI